MNEVTSSTINRNAIFKDLNRFITEHQSSGKKFALLLIHINQFRQLNITHGYASGDNLLKEFSERLHNLSRQQDYIARIGNSEFIMVLPEIFNTGHSLLAAQKILNSLNELFKIGTSRHKVSVNIGIAIFSDHANTTETLLKCAERALLDARHEIQSYAVFSEKTQSVGYNSWDIELDLQNAQERDEFELFFQPQVCLQNRRIFGAEALLRWKNKDRGFIRPDVFIPVAERNGQIHEITWWTINAALRLIKDWPVHQAPLKVAINLSAKVLTDPGLVDSIFSAIKIWGANPQQLILEVTESALMDDMTTSLETLNELKALGLSISIDDFGTGYSSLAYFKSIPANELKIDQTFIRYMLENDMDRHIVKTIIKMAHGFNLKVVAEGIEDKETFKALKEMGCDVAQGYYLAKPMPQQDFIQWVNDYKPEQLQKAY